MSDWADRRSDAARVQSERLAARQNAAHEKAEALMALFFPVVTVHGPAPVALKVRGYGGRSQARTPLHGWYLRVDRTAALATDGAFYQLIAPLTWWDRLHGVSPKPSRPLMVLNENSKDGDSVALEDAMERILPGWRKYASDTRPLL